MPIQTAPSTITVATAGGNTVFTLSDLNDEMATYRMTTIDGTAEPTVAKQPVLTISRVAASPKNGYKTTYQYQLVHPTFDALGNRLQSTLWKLSIVVPQVGYGNTDQDVVEESKAFGLLFSNATLNGMLIDGAFLR